MARNFVAVLDLSGKRAHSSIALVPYISNRELLALWLPWIRKKNLKNKNSAHGGFFATLADIALGKTQCRSEIPPIPLVTTNLKIDYLGAAQLGKWIEATANFFGIGRDLAFVNCYICGECRLVCANGVYEATNLS